MKAKTGVLKYKESEKAISLKKKKLPPKVKAVDPSPEEYDERVGKMKKVEEELKSAQCELAVISLPEKLSEEAVETAVDEVVAASEKAKEEAELQREIAAELEKESVHTSQLVKEDFSPVNSSREKLVLEYSP